MYRLRSVLNFKILCFLTIRVCCCVSTKFIPEEENQSLQLIHILFRHGERTNINNVLYPNDPHINETYFPYGMGELTNKGKKTEYKLGKKFRERYDKFLGKTYWPGLVEAWSSNRNRTKTSLMLVLAGLFPPTAKEIWEEGFPWQPIPFNFHYGKEDKLFFGLQYCPRYHKEYQNHIQSDKMVKKLAEYKELFQYMSQNTGWNVTDFRYIFKLYVCLKVEEEWGLELPLWTKKIYSQLLEELTPQIYISSTATANMKRVVAGYLLKKIIDNTKAKINNEEFMQQKKIYLYSGHEFNLGALLSTLDIFDPLHIPPYGSYIIIELHKLNGVNGIKIFYENYKSSNGPQLMTLPGCESFCEFGKFVSLVEEYLPTNDSCGTETKCSNNSL